MKSKSTKKKTLKKNNALLRRALTANLRELMKVKEEKKELEDELKRCRDALAMTRSLFLTTQLRYYPQILHSACLDSIIPKNTWKEKNKKEQKEGKGEEEKKDDKKEKEKEEKEEEKEEEEKEEEEIKKKRDVPEISHNPIEYLVKKKRGKIEEGIKEEIGDCNRYLPIELEKEYERELKECPVRPQIDASRELYGPLARDPVYVCMGKVCGSDEMPSLDYDDNAKLGLFPKAKIDECCFKEEPDCLPEEDEDLIKKVLDAKVPEEHELLFCDYAKSTKPKDSLKEKKRVASLEAKLKEIDISLPSIYAKSRVYKVKEYFKEFHGPSWLGGLNELSHIQAEAIAIISEYDILCNAVKKWNPCYIYTQAKLLMASTPRAIGTNIKNEGISFAFFKSRYKKTGNLYSIIMALGHKLMQLSLRHAYYVKEAKAQRKKI